MCFSGVSCCENGESLECLATGLADLFNAMEDLKCQIELSDSVDSGHCSENDDLDGDGGMTEGADETTEPELADDEMIGVVLCKKCVKSDAAKVIF